jgi:hypothetical protein
MDSWMIIVVVGTALVTAAAVSWVVIGKLRSDDLRRRFGTEYDFAVKTHRSRARAEADLASRTSRVEGLYIRSLSASDHDSFADKWRSTQDSFVDDPWGAVSKAETLVEDVMRARGYPVGDFDQQAADLSVDHSDSVRDYREARELAVVSQRGMPRIEDLRRATVYFRALFEELLETAQRGTVVPRR